MVPILQLILSSAPAIVSAIQAAHQAANPGAPPLTAEEIHAGFEDAVTSTLLKDALIQASLHGGQS